MATRHNDGFRNEPVFASAYARAVQAGGWDWGVRWRVHQHLWCAELARKFEGDIADLGTGRGFSVVEAKAGVRTLATSMVITSGAEQAALAAGSV